MSTFIYSHPACLAHRPGPHHPESSQRLEAVPHEGFRALDGGDSIMSPGSWGAVLRCVGAACAAVDSVVSGRARNAFCATRPCGHPAEAERALMQA